MTVGGVFTVIGALSWWRGHIWPPVVLGSLGVMLIVPGVLAPRLLAPIERRWMAIAGVLGRFNTRVLLTLVYLGVLLSIGVLLRLRRDPLDRRIGTDRASHWIPRDDAESSPDSYRQQF